MYSPLYSSQNRRPDRAVLSLVYLKQLKERPGQPIIATPMGAPGTIEALGTLLLLSIATLAAKSGHASNLHTQMDRGGKVWLRRNGGRFPPELFSSSTSSRHFGNPTTNSTIRHHQPHL